MFYGWVIVAVAFCTIMMMMGTWYSFSIFYVAILEEFGWSRAATASVFTVYAVVHGLLALPWGFAVRRWGSRAVIVIGSAVMGVGFILSSRTSAVWHLYVFYGCIVAIGSSACGYPANGSVVSNWFHRRRGLAMGMAFSGVGVGIIVLGPLSQQLIDAYGWRTAYVFLALFAVCIVLPLNLFFSRYHPSHKGLSADGLAEQTSAAAVGPSGVAWNLGEAFRSLPFWCVFGAHALSSLLLMIVMIHQFAFLIDLGMARTVAAGLISVVGFFNICGQLLGGFLCDRVGSEVSYSVHASFIVLALVLLMLLGPGTPQVFFILYAMLFGMGAGGVGSIPAVAGASIFHGPNYAAVQGASSMGWGLGGGIGPLLAGWIFDVTNSYQSAFAIAMLICAAGTATIWIAAPRYYRQLSAPVAVSASAGGAPP